MNSPENSSEITYDGNTATIAITVADRHHEYVLKSVPQTEVEYLARNILHNLVSTYHLAYQQGKSDVQASVKKALGIK